MNEIAPLIRSGLSYPFAGPPGRGEFLQVAPDIYWICMPLPFGLDHINLWLIKDGEGWTLVDTGMNLGSCRQVWEELLSHWLDDKPLTRIIVTHMHSDHVGLAGWLAERYGCRLWMSRLDYLNSRLTVAEAGVAGASEVADFFRRAGWSQAAIDTHQESRARFASLVYPLPGAYRRLQDGEEISIGEYQWRIIVGIGHSPEHICLYCPKLKIFISGDQVLPRITSNLSTYPSEAEADPLADWYVSLDKLGQAVPDDVLVLPSHNECFHGLHERLDQLWASADDAVVSLRRALHQPKRVIDVFPALFSRPISAENPVLLRLATGEAISHLNFLLHRGEAVCELDQHGVAWYQVQS